MQLGGAWDRNNPGLLREQPGERNLSRCRLLPFCDLANQINQGLIRFARLRRKARESVAEIGTVEHGIFVDLSREKAPTQRAIRNKTDSEFFERRQYFRFRVSHPQRVFALDRSDRLNCVCATDRLHSWLRKAEVLDFTFLNQILHRSGDLFDRHAGINTVLIEQIDNIGPESLERSFSNFFDVLWPAIEADLLAFRTKFKSELGGDHHS